MDIDDKRCLITGAGRGLGRRIALDLRAKGVVVVATDVNEESLADLRSSEGMLVKTVDVADEASVKELFAFVESELGGLDVLVNNAGITRDGLLVKLKDDELSTMPLDDFRRVVEVNLVGVFLCGREAAAMMAKGDGGVIVNMSSVSRAGNFGQTNYSAAKAGVDAMTVAWSKELARHGIRCAAVAPGYIGTEMVKAIPQKALDRITAQVPLNRLGEPEEISQTVQFIIENDFVNGKILEVDGGLRV